MQDSEISLVELCQMLWDGKWIVVTTTFIFGLFGISYSLVLPDKYQVSTAIKMGKQSAFLQYSSLDELLKENGLFLIKPQTQTDTDLIEKQSSRVL